MFPVFKINQVIKNLTGTDLIGGISSDFFEGEKWVDDKWLGFLRLNNSLVYGRWHKQNDDWKFVAESKDNPKLDFFIGQELSLFDGYWGERIELVIDKSLNWKEATYSISNDHDHCFICWATISEFENREYMLGNDRVGVCLNCFKNYIEQDSFDFITYPKK